MTEWKLADAKNRFSELVNLALQEGPQVVRRRKDVVVVLSGKDYERLKRKKSATFKSYLLQGEPFDGLDLERDQSPGRKVVL